MAQHSEEEYRRALFMAAAHLQGGHSFAGGEVADVLEIPFPINMDNLKSKAESEGFIPADLWPWWKRT